MILLTPRKDLESGEFVFLYMSETRQACAIVYKEHGKGCYTRYEAEDVRPGYMQTLAPVPEKDRATIPTLERLIKEAYPAKNFAVCY